jgi:hypothetical protein
VAELSIDLRHKEGLAEKVVSELHKRQEEVHNTIGARPDWLRERHDVDQSLGFVAMPYREEWFRRVLPAINNGLQGHRLRCLTAEDVKGRGSVLMADVWKGICISRLVVADITGNNPNVAYETALADLLGKPVIITMPENP